MTVAAEFGLKSNNGYRILSNYLYCLALLFCEIYALMAEDCSTESLIRNRISAKRKSSFCLKIRMEIPIIHIYSDTL